MVKSSKLVTYETLDPNPIKKFIVCQFKYINFKNLSKKKKITKKASSKPRGQPGSTNQTHDVEHETGMTI